jgi:hypothetical protein
MEDIVDPVGRVFILLKEGIYLVLHMLSQLADSRVTARGEEVALTGLIVTQNALNWKKWVRRLHVESTNVAFVEQFIVENAHNSKAL